LYLGEGIGIEGSRGLSLDFRPSNISARPSLTATIFVIHNPRHHPLPTCASLLMGKSNEEDVMENVSECSNVIGIDIGSVSLSIVLMDLDGKILDSAYTFHKGNIPQSLRDIQSKLDISHVGGIAGVSSSARFNTDLVHLYNTQIAIIAATKFHQPDAASILHVGAERFMLIQFDSNGDYQLTRTNSSCAAGTGSFLDQQADRLSLSGAEELCLMALDNNEPTPEIASRCAVFARTDLIHAQQRGYSKAAICDSLCKGLASNIANATFNKIAVNYPLLITGGVSKNTAVIKDLEKLAGVQFLTNANAHLFGAIGAALMLLKEKSVRAPMTIASLEDVLKHETKGDNYYGPLDLKLSSYPDFTSEKNFHFTPQKAVHSKEVEIHFYKKFGRGDLYPVYLGIDIGSTSTKAVLLDKTKEPLIGLYTYTAGNPLSSVKSLFEAIENITISESIDLAILGVGTTGSGRSFIGKIIGADLILDEITTHARAAYELNPETDTIIEIGGQDSKFTMMDHGRVTFSQMNTVCAAGTGSFIEEQALKLNCPLKEYDGKAAKVGSPMASDRCTVFMERDINQLLSKGNSVNEILATVLHSVTENYVKRVASEASIGKQICFQGATARNRSLVAAFEQRINRPIFVSKYCHLAGALGTALLLMEEHNTATAFRGLKLYEENIPVQTETCTLCNNNCSISVAELRGEKVAYGFVCGRDYETQRKVSKNQSGFDLIRERRKIFSSAIKVSKKPKPVIGIPVSLHLFEEFPVWKRFFSELGIRTISSDKNKESLKQGKLVAGAEFCAPIDSLYGDVTYLTSKVDYIFLPVFLQAHDKPKDSERYYCYYTQFSPSLIYNMKGGEVKDKCLSPLLNFSKGNFQVAVELYKCLNEIIPDINFYSVYTALTNAFSHFNVQKEKLKDMFNHHFKDEKNLSVVLLGRPYVVLSPELNKGIPDIFNGLGIKTFYQDMLPTDKTETGVVDSLLKKVPWYYASKILEAAHLIANTPKLYPVLITAFRCAPDSFIIEYFKKILTQSNKPYLILQIDEHNSNVGYETRIEAAVRSFKNHAALSIPSTEIADKEILPEIETDIGNKTLLMPGWDPIVTPLLVANLKRIGIDARMMESSSMIIKKSMAHNTGQCLPVNIIAQEFIEYIKEHNLVPANTILFMLDSKVTCNIRLYPQFIKGVLQNYGNGMEKAHVYCGAISHLEISLSACYHAYFAYMIGGLIRRLGCRIRPYELQKGQTNKVIDESVKLLEQAFLGKKDVEKTVIEAVALFDEIPREDRNRPKVALFGDFYVCDNDVINQDLCQSIEDAGGEVITIPYSDYVKINRDNVVRRWMERGDYYKALQLRLILASLKLIDHRYYKPFMKYLGTPHEIDPSKLEKHLTKFNINRNLGGESYDNILKIFYIMESYPDTALFVQTNPSFCCPSLVTEAMSNQIKQITGIPVATITYDGTDENKNDIIIPYLQEKGFSLEKTAK
jgi:predicted CoA-substrate-specific enzyme activase